MGRACKAEVARYLSLVRESPPLTSGVYLLGGNCFDVTFRFMLSVRGLIKSY